MVSIVSQWVLYTIYACFMALTLLRLARGDIRTKGMLSVGGGSDASPERVQLLVISLFAMGSYLFQAVNAFSGTIKLKVLPDPPDALLGVFAASNVAYLGIKALRTFGGR